MRRDESRRLRARAHDLIPGGAHTYAKGDDQYPADAPGFIARGSGCTVWDVDGNEFLEYGMGLRAVTLGHAYAPVLAAVRAQLELGVNFTRPAAIEVACAEQFLNVVAPDRDWMVKFAKNGSDATTAAVKLARAHTGRDVVAICAGQPFFSTDDWFIGSTAMPAGVTDTTRRLTARFGFNDPDSLAALFAAHPGRIAALVLEAAYQEPPAPGYLDEVRRLCDEHGTLLIVDEIINGFRIHQRGAAHLHGLTPDLVTFAKGMANGFSVAALAGRADVMELGGLRTRRERVFLLSSTYGAETHALAAAMATMSVYQAEPVIDRLRELGERLASGVRAVAAARGLSEHVDVAGHPANLVYVTRDAAGNRSQEFRTLFLDQLIRQGIIAPSFVVSYSHTETDIDRTVEAVDHVLGTYAKALADGVEHHLSGRPVQPVFRPYN
ncbi:glutamate-1-semialdehyde 2,1-aminomutase [Catellatospora chokoriensis]|uniref:Glutamate-1-semialdehyde 2,1-aminomutase n=1 Tax=Catellatospora chokoriensis TaxID=310353 RepID=A0A8J3NQN5_9ACTN|nr:glutamate-1-semialdehyde 2,1-aminomutase [Catellatospora chokoriensis]GIF87215.1 glutamate-1-semialdehyde 2,1-aminomutase [Catellatospora chokoriensis]